MRAKRLKIGAAFVELTVREWALLELFLAHPGWVLSKDQIAQQLVNYYEALNPNTVESYVSRLRAKIEPANVRIRTVRGFGATWLSSEPPGVVPGTEGPARDGHTCVLARDGRCIALTESHGTWLRWLP